MRTYIILVCTLVLGGGAQARDIYRCVSPNGEVTLTNLKCPTNSSVHLVGTYEPVPDSPNQRLDAAIQAADISAQQAREAAMRAESAANHATQSFYQDGAPAEHPAYDGDPNVYVPAWIPGYGYGRQFDAHFPGHRHRDRSYVDGPHPEPHQSSSRHMNSAPAHQQRPAQRLAYSRSAPHARPTAAPPPGARPQAAPAARH